MRILADESVDMAVVRALIVQATVDLIANHGERLAGSFVVLEPGRVRFHQP